MIELIVVIGIFTSLLFISIPSYLTIRENVALKNESFEITSALRKAQNDAIVSKSGKKHGVRFAADGMSFSVFEESGPTIVEHRFVKGIKIYEGAGTEVVFNRLTGQTASATITVGLSSGKQKDIMIDETGKILVNDQ